MIELVGRLQVSGEDVEQTGLPADLWLTVEGRMTASDRRMLAAVAEHLTRLPLTKREATNGGLSWSQLRTIIMILIRHQIRHDEWGAVDAAVADAVGRAVADDPDDVVRLVEDWLWRRHPDQLEQEEADQAERRYLHLQPRLDGLGGRFHGETDATGLALLDAATTPAPDQLSDDERLTPVGTVGRARHDNLMARLAGGSTDGVGLPEVTNLVTMDYDTLVGLSGSHADMLASLAGGRLKVSGPTARRLIDDGFDARLIVLDETGQVLGVGRKRRQAPDWLREALVVRDATCTFPGCRRAGVVCQADHAIPWTVGGTTDINNLALVCGPHNRTKERHGWKVTGHPDGSRSWHHPRSGLTARIGSSPRRLATDPPDPPAPF